MKIAIFASGNGSNFQTLTEACSDGSIAGTVSLLFSDQPESYVMQRAKKLEIPSVAFSLHDFPTKIDYEEKILEVMRQYQINLIVLAGYMRLIGPTLLKAFPQRIINIHPSYLPQFKGRNGIKDAYDAGVHETGVTVHFVDEGIDTGKIITQAKVPILSEDTLETLETKIHEVEHWLYPDALAALLNNRNLKGKEGMMNE